MNSQQHLSTIQDFSDLLQVCYDPVWTRGLTVGDLFLALAVFALLTR